MAGDMPSETEAVVEFARHIIRLYAWGDEYPDGGDIQSCAERLGLIKLVQFDPSRHHDAGGYGFHADDPWYEFAGSLAIKEDGHGQE